MVRKSSQHCNANCELALVSMPLTSNPRTELSESVQGEESSSASLRSFVEAPQNSPPDIKEFKELHPGRVN